MISTYLIISFNPEVKLFYKQLTAIENNHVIIVDNGSDTATITLLRSWVKEKSSLRILVENNKNIGIAGAQNIGMLLADKMNFKFVLLLDHDSIPSQNLIESLEKIAEDKLKNDSKFAAIGSRIFDPRSKKELGFFSMKNGVWRKQLCSQDNNEIIKCEFLNSSGTLLYLTAWKEIGIFEEKFFIDHVESEWCMRAKYSGYHLYGACQCELDHYMGDDVIYYWLFGNRSMPYRRPERHYTIVRNSLWLYRRSYVPLSWKCNNFVKLLFTMFYFSLFDKEPVKQFTHIMKGFYDGFLCKESL